MTPEQRNSQRLLAAIQNLQPGSDNYGWAAIEWMNTNTPNGRVTLNKESHTVTFDMTDGSKLMLDLSTGIFSEVQ